MCASHNQESSYHLFVACTIAKALTDDIIDGSMQLGGNTIRDKWDLACQRNNKAHGRRWYGHHGGSATRGFSKTKERTCGHWSLRQHLTSNNGTKQGYN